MLVLDAISQPMVSTCFKKIIEDILQAVQLWQLRYGHLVFKGLKTLQQRQMVNGLSQFQPLSKLSRVSWQANNTGTHFQRRTLGDLQKIFNCCMHICGAIKPISNSKKRYLLTFTDYCSKKIRFIFWQKNQKPLVFFKSFKSHVENETSSFLRSICND